MDKNIHSKTVEVFSGPPFEAEVVKGLLESNGILCVVKDGILGTLAPYMAPAVTILVTEDDYENAADLVNAYESESKG